MNQSTLFLMFAIIIAAAEATEHSTCFNYFMKKDKCVFSSADPKTRCKAPPKDHPAPVKAFSLGSQNPQNKNDTLKTSSPEEKSKPQDANAQDSETQKSNSSNPKPSSRLARRYDATKPVFPVGGGNGICGFYNSTTEIGVCLWSGAEQTNPTTKTAGWLNGYVKIPAAAFTLLANKPCPYSLKTSNCGKRIYIQRAGKPDTVQYARVLDGCGFDTVKLDVGCSQIGVTVALFNKFKPSADEQARQLLLGGITWDFDNLNGTSTQQAPV